MYAGKIDIGQTATGLHLHKLDRFTLPDQNTYRIKKELAAGPDRRVYRVIRESDDRVFAFKHARDASIPKGERGIQKEITTVAALRELGIPHPPIEVHGTDWLLRDWVPGELGVHWFKRWKREGFPASDYRWQKFFEMVRSTASQGVVIGAMDLDDIMWLADDWVVIDSGRVRRMPVDEAWEYYEDDLIYSWGTKIGEESVCPFLLTQMRGRRALPGKGTPG